jgi:hypothetical protein
VEPCGLLIPHLFIIIIVIIILVPAIYFHRHLTFSVAVCCIETRRGWRARPWGAICRVAVEVRTAVHRHTGMK